MTQSLFVPLPRGITFPNQGNIWATKPFCESISSPRVDAIDKYDTEIALQRLAEMKQSPEKVLRGEALNKKIKQWLT